MITVDNLFYIFFETKIHVFRGAREDIAISPQDVVVTKYGSPGVSCVDFAEVDKLSRVEELGLIFKVQLAFRVNLVDMSYVALLQLLN